MPTTNPRAMERMPTDRATTPRSRQSVREGVGGVSGIVFPRIKEPADASSREKRGIVGLPAQRYLSRFYQRRTGSTGHTRVSLAGTNHFPQGVIDGLRFNRQPPIHIHIASGSLAGSHVAGIFRVRQEANQLLAAIDLPERLA
jgi:hypothetical protein